MEVHASVDYDLPGSLCVRVPKEKAVVTVIALADSSAEFFESPVTIDSFTVDLTRE